MENEKENIDLNEGDFVDMRVYLVGSFFGRVIKKYKSAQESFFIAAFCDYSAKGIFYKLVRVCEGNIFVIQGASNFSEYVTGEDNTVSIIKLEHIQYREVIDRISKEINNRIGSEIMREHEFKRLFE